MTAAASNVQGPWDPGGIAAWLCGTTGVGADQDSAVLEFHPPPGRGVIGSIEWVPNTVGPLSRRAVSGNQTHEKLAVIKLATGSALTVLSSTIHGEQTQIINAGLAGQDD